MIAFKASQSPPKDWWDAIRPLLQWAQVSVRHVWIHQFGWLSSWADTWVIMMSHDEAGMLATMGARFGQFGRSSDLTWNIVTYYETWEPENLSIHWPWLWDRCGLKPARQSLPLTSPRLRWESYFHCNCNSYYPTPMHTVAWYRVDEMLEVSALVKWVFFCMTQCRLFVCLYLSVLQWCTWAHMNTVSISVL